MQGSQNVSLEDLWRYAEKLGHWAWRQQKSYLPREAWCSLRDQLPNAPVDPAVIVQVTRQAARDTPWRNLWGGAPRQRLMRKMFEIASRDTLTVRDVAHLAYNAGQVEASGAVSKLRRLAEEPSLAALANVANMYESLRLGSLQAYIKPEAFTLPVSANISDEAVDEIMGSVVAKHFPTLPADRHWGGPAAVVVAVCLAIIVVIAYYAGRLVSKSPKLIYAAVGLAAFVGAGGVYLAYRRGVMQ